LEQDEMKLVITGALGHIGSRLIRSASFCVPDVELILVDNLLTQRYCSLFGLPDGSNHRFVQADILTANLAEIFADADAVVHLAAITDAATSFDKRSDVEQVNLVGTKAVARACVETGCALLFPSTTSVYGPQGDVVDEECSDKDLRPQSPYAESKLAAERYLQTLGAKDELNYVICRFGTIFGTSVGMRFHTAVNKFCWQAVMGEPLTVWRTALDQRRPYLDLGDAVRAVEFVLESDLFNRSIYNVLTVNMTVAGIVDAIQAQLPESRVEFVDKEIMNQLSYSVSSQRFEDQGFEFEGCIEKGIEHTIDLLRGVVRD
jgi:UDP-glucose 4-epimerase